MKNIAVLTSGLSRGSNFNAIVDYINNNNLQIEVKFVTINRKKALIQNKCKFYKIPAIFISTKDFHSFEEKLLLLFKKHKIHLIVLAGFMRQFSADFLKKIQCNIVNIHPALLPKFGGKGMYGMAVHQAVYEAQEQKSGATVHYVNENYDEGKIIRQLSVDISNCKSASEIGDRVLKIEHKLYPKTIAELLERK